MKNAQKGFSLIELMIIVAIIGTLSAIAIPSYANYQAKAKLAAGLAEITPGKTAVEVKLYNGEIIANAAAIGLAATTNNCTTTVEVANTGIAFISCSIANASGKISAAKMTWTRTVSGEWSCASMGIVAGYEYLAPKTCKQV